MKKNKKKPSRAWALPEPIVGPRATAASASAGSYEPVELDRAHSFSLEGIDALAMLASGGTGWILDYFDPQEVMDGSPACQCQGYYVCVKCRIKKAAKRTKRRTR